MEFLRVSQDRLSLFYFFLRHLNRFLARDIRGSFFASGGEEPTIGSLSQTFFTSVSGSLLRGIDIDFSKIGSSFGDRSLRICKEGSLEIVNGLFS